MATLLLNKPNGPVAEFPQNGSQLKSMAPELRLGLLLTLDLESLRSVVLASPVFHAQYRKNRDLVLRTILIRELDGFVPEAIGVLMSSAPVMGPTRTDPKIEVFLAWYHSWQIAPALCPSLKDVTLGALIKLANFHLSTAIPFARELTQWAYHNMMSDAWSSLPAWPPAMTGVTVSKTESILIFFGVYRYQTFHNLFGHNETRRVGQFTSAEIHELFFSAFQPWEIEVMTSIDQFLREFYPLIFNRVEQIITERLRVQDPSFAIWGLVPRPNNSVYLTGTISRGLEVAMRIFRAQVNDDQLFNEATHYMIIYNQADPSYQQTAMTIVSELFSLSEIEYVVHQHGGEAQPQGLPVDIAPPNAPTADWALFWEPLAPTPGWALSWNILTPHVYYGGMPLSLRRWMFTIWDDHRWADSYVLFALYSQLEAIENATLVAQLLTVE